MHCKNTILKYESISKQCISLLSTNNNKFKIFSTLCVPEKLSKIFDPYQDKIEFEMNETLLSDRKNTLEKIKTCDSLICSPYDRIDKELLETAQNLKFISTFSIGYEHIDIAECSKRNIRITTCPYFNSGTMAEFTIGLMINLSRNITIAANKIRGADWKQFRNDLYWLSGVGLKDSVVGIVGLGNIGMGVATRLTSFGIKKIIYHNRKPNLDAEKLGFEYASFDSLLEKSDFVVCSCSINKQSEGLFNKEAFDKMKSNAIFVNVSRGVAVNQEDLYDALKSGKILAAGLDVTTPQPLPADHKLYTLDNCLITPHLAWAETKTTDDRVSVCLQNVLNFYLGTELVSEIKNIE
ncbi:unnamed protein product [Brachionus calyciflorus]|uniref:Glyoxylate reductase/hydroxypyruvate reductase n=1 Tax=Brachionus calyciflorus TaxID=104777 RepID=A0A814APS0_9BILA|nr:unnamed protein product [Brachionus calyciflorus]